MIIPMATTATPTPHTITMADGQTFTVLVGKPTFNQRFEDEGREALAFAGVDNAWAAYRLGRIRAAIVDWQDVTNEKGQTIPFTTQRLLGLLDAAPEVVPQVVAIANEVFRPLVLAKLSANLQTTSGQADASQPEQPLTSSSDTASSADSPTLPEQSESPPQN